MWLDQANEKLWTISGVVKKATEHRTQSTTTTVTRMTDSEIKSQLRLSVVYIIDGVPMTFRIYNHHRCRRCPLTVSPLRLYTLVPYLPPSLFHKCYTKQKWNTNIISLFLVQKYRARERERWMESRQTILTRQ